MIRVNDEISIDESELHETFVRAGGPGGQHVNKVSTAVQLRFDVLNSTLPPYVKERLQAIGGGKVTEGGEILILSRESRSREANREAAIARLVELIRNAAHRPKKRLKTRPSRSATEKRIATKKTRSGIKKNRIKVRGED